MSEEGTVRSTFEMQFAQSLQPCPKCGTRAPRFDLYGNGDDWILSGLCPSCKLARRFDFKSAGDPMHLPPHPRLELGGPEPSRVITAAQFAAELERLIPFLGEDPATIAVSEWQERSRIGDRALTCINELRKFPAEQQPEHLAEWYDRALALNERFTADAARTWLLRKAGKLHPSEEIRALWNQASTKRPITAADLERWLSIRGDLAKDSAAKSLRVWDDAEGTHAEVTYSRGTLDDLRDAFGGVITKSPTLATAEAIVAGHRVCADIEHADKRLVKVTLHFTRVS